MLRGTGKVLSVGWSCLRSVGISVFCGWLRSVGYGRIGGLSLPCLIKFWVSHILGTVPDDFVADFIANIIFIPIIIVFVDFRN
jgi:hypothetical protein